MKPFILLLLTGTASAHAETLVVTVTGIQSEEGQLGCALFQSPDGFPMNSSKAAGLRLKPKTEGVECRFEKVAPGTYAVAVSHDRNSNGKTDTNFVGIPTEDWGVSNNVRPRIRAPRFEEAAFPVAAGRETRIVIRVAR